MTMVRKATSADTDKVEVIMNDARKYLGSQGLPQWQGPYGPNRKALEKDAQHGYGYVLEVDGAVHGYAAIEPGPDADYEALKNGSWEGLAQSYAVIHRVMIGEAMRGRRKGSEFLRLLVEEAIRLGYKDVRIDTHPANAIMKRVVAESGFIQRGDIMMNIPDGERVAFQMLIS